LTEFRQIVATFRQRRSLALRYQILFLNFPKNVFFAANFALLNENLFDENIFDDTTPVTSGCSVVASCRLRTVEASCWETVVRRRRRQRKYWWWRWELGEAWATWRRSRRWGTTATDTVGTAERLVTGSDCRHLTAATASLPRVIDVRRQASRSWTAWPCRRRSSWSDCKWCDWTPTWQCRTSSDCAAASTTTCQSVSVKARTERRNWTELNWHALVFDELTNEQAVMHYRRHRLTALVAYMTYMSANDQ